MNTRAREVAAVSESQGIIDVREGRSAGSTVIGMIGVYSELPSSFCGADVGWLPLEFTSVWESPYRFF